MLLLFSTPFMIYDFTIFRKYPTPCIENKVVTVCFLIISFVKPENITLLRKESIHVKKKLDFLIALLSGYFLSNINPIKPSSWLICVLYYWHNYI